MNLSDEHNGQAYYIFDENKPKLIDGIKEIEIESHHDELETTKIPKTPSELSIVFSREACLEMMKFFNLIMPNNWKKLHGLPMRRHVQLRNIGRKHI